MLLWINRKPCHSLLISSYIYTLNCNTFNFTGNMISHYFPGLVEGFRTWAHIWTKSPTEEMGTLFYCIEKRRDDHVYADSLTDTVYLRLFYKQLCYKHTY